MKARISIPIMLAVSAACFFPSPHGVFAAENAPHIPRPLFPAVLPEGMTADAKLIGALHFRLPPPIDTLALPVPAPETVTIAGEATATEAQMLAYLLRQNPNPKLTGTAKELVHAYYIEAAREGVRPDVALSQAYKETGCFAYGGDVHWQQNNFCGLGATGGGAKGLSFPDMQTGVRAHIQHLLAYSRKTPPTAPLVDPRYDLIRTNRPDIYGRLTHWTELNGVWAVPGRNYGQEILMILARAQQPDGSDAALHAAKERLARSDDADAHLYRGMVYLRRAAYAEALADFAAAKKRDGKRPEAALGTAFTHAAAGSMKEARRTYETYLRMAPDDAAGWYNYGLTLLSTGAPEKAVTAFQKSLAHAPQRAAAQNARAIAEIRTGDYAAAWRTLHEAAELDPADTNILINQILFETCLTEGHEHHK